MMLYRREKYLKKIRSFYHDNEIIKVITGVRGCGISSFIFTIIEELKESGINDNQIIYLNLDKKEYKNIKTLDQLEQLIDKKSITDNMKYLFIDEIQNVDKFEELINAYCTDGDYSRFITGSNSYLLSGELATKLTGRYIEFEVYPLSFDEYLEMKEFIKKPVDSNLQIELNNYLQEGGFPKTLQYDSSEDKRTYVK